MKMRYLSHTGIAFLLFATLSFTNVSRAQDGTSQTAIAAESTFFGGVAAAVDLATTDLLSLAGINSTETVTVGMLDGAMYEGGLLGAVGQVASFMAGELTAVAVGVALDVDLVINAGNAAVDAWNASQQESQTAADLQATLDRIAAANSTTSQQTQSSQPTSSDQGVGYWDYQIVGGHVEHDFHEETYVDEDGNQWTVTVDDGEEWVDDWDWVWVGC